MSTTHELIAGALYDFMGRLTTGEEEITLSGHHEPHRLLAIFEAWAAERRLNVANADVQHWSFRISDPYPGIYRVQVPEEEIHENRRGEDAEYQRQRQIDLARGAQG